MQPGGTTAVLMLLVALVATGCGRNATSAVEVPTGAGPAPVALESADPTRPTTTTTTTTTESTPTETPTGSPTTTAPTTTTTTTTVPAIDVDEIDTLLAGLDETLAELDELLNQAAAALAAEEGEILP